ncbi:uncharacterized protein LOC110939603 [Helianthus annuus]|uniref:uncharacterized protein LOC110939603 n=1 Tax=Helianthus annuus TaxID=4232 RepID=UPI000B8F73D2|nr:uncharacterized protein LOC110939603 [Helianthus annuus]
MESTKLHPASTVSNIKSLIPITLEMETGQYASWSELFKIQCRAFLVIDHLSPKPPAPAASSSKDTDKDKDKVTTPVDDQWDRLDAIVLQWIYATISNDLLHTILKPNTTAYDAWTTLEGIFQDNKSSRAIHLLHKFSNTRLDGFSNVSAYCQQLKMIADQLANVGSPVENDRLVLQLISGLNEQYEGIATILQQQDPLPTFYEARSKLVLVESRKTEQALNMAQTAGTPLTQTLPGLRTKPTQTRSEAVVVAEVADAAEDGRLTVAGVRSGRQDTLPVHQDRAGLLTHGLEINSGLPTTTSTIIGLSISSGPPHPSGTHGLLHHRALIPLPPLGPALILADRVFSARDPIKLTILPTHPPTLTRRSTPCL